MIAISMFLMVTAGLVMPERTNLHMAPDKRVP